MQFKLGDRLRAIYFENGEELVAGKSCDDIVVVMENGQMSGVPWFEVWENGRVVSGTPQNAKVSDTL